MHTDQTQGITAKEAARLLDKHLQTIYRLANRGKLPGTRVGGVWTFNGPAIRAMSDGRPTGTYAHTSAATA